MQKKIAFDWRKDPSSVSTMRRLEEERSSEAGKRRNVRKERRKDRSRLNQNTPFESETHLDVLLPAFEGRKNDSR